MSFSRIQSSFSAGELDPRLNARVDWEGFLKGAQKLQNVIVIPQGGVTKRFGTDYVAEIDGIPSDDDVKLAIFEVGANSTYEVIFAPLKIYIYSDSILIATLDSPYDVGDITGIRYAQDASHLTIVHPKYPPKLLYYTSLLPPTWALNDVIFKNQPVYDFLRNYFTVNFTFVLVAGGTPGIASYGKSVTVTASTGIFSTLHIGGIILVSSMIIRITAYTDTTHVTGRIIVPPTQDTAAGNGADISIQTPVWNADNGYPASVTFFQNRLVFGGNLILPEMINMSRIGDFVDFNEWDGTASAAITTFVRGNKAHDILFVLGAQSLLIFTINGQFSTPILTDQAISIQNIAFNQQTKNSIAPVQPQLLDSQIMFADKGGKIIRSLSYNIQAGAFNGSNISVKSSQLIDSPTDSATYNNPATNDGEVLFLVNDGVNGGSLAVYQSLQEESIDAWTEQTTQGDFVKCAASNDKGYFIVRRLINGESKYYLERISKSFTDCTITVILDNGTVVDGLDALNGKTVQVLADGLYVGDFEVIAGQITLQKSANYVNIGLGIAVEVKPMPISVEMKGGPSLYQPKHINTGWADFYKTLGATVDGVDVPFLQYDEVDDIPKPQDSLFKFTPSLGWDWNNIFSITHNAPYPFTLRGIGIMVDV